MNMEARSLSQTRILLPSPPLRPRHVHKQHGHFHVAAVLTSPPDNLSGVAQRNSSRRRSDNSAVILTEKNAYNDNMFERMAIDHLSHSVQAATGLRNNKKGYESLVQAASDASRKFTLAQQRELVLLALARAIPKLILDLIKTVTPASKFSREYFAAFTTLFFAWLIGPCELRESEFNGRREKNVVHIKKCRFLEETNCVGMCTNLCKVPSQTFIKDSLGMPVSMVPNFDDMSCEMIFGQDPPPLTEDPAFNQPCYKLCKSNKSHSVKCPSQHL